MAIFLVAVVLASGCTNNGEETGVDSNNPSDVEINSKNEGLIEKITDSFSSDATKIKKEILSLNDEENQTFLTNIDISKKENTLQMEVSVIDDSISKFALNLYAIMFSIKSYEITQNFEELKIIYLNDKKKQLGIITIPKKAIKDLADYAKENNDKDYLNSPYIEPFWEISTVMYDESVPELIPLSLSKDIFGSFGSKSDTDEISEALGKTVTHLSIQCYYSYNWDADAEDDGINYFVKPLSEDNTVVPIEGTFETTVYEQILVGDIWSADYEEGKLLYKETGLLEGNERLKKFDEWKGYEVKLEWDSVESYMASSSDYGSMHVTFTDKDGNSFSAKYDACKLRES